MTKYVLLGFGILFMGIVCAVDINSGFEPSSQFLSELGGSGISALFFNTGVAIGGLLTIPFWLCLVTDFEESNLTIAIIVSGFISSLGLIGIGVFNITELALHVFFDCIFFTSILLAISLTSYHFFVMRKYVRAAMGLIVLLINLCCLFMLSFAALQKVTVYSIGFWFLLMVLYLRIKYPVKKFWPC